MSSITSISSSDLLNTLNQLSSSSSSVSSSSDAISDLISGTVSETDSELDNESSATSGQETSGDDYYALASSALETLISSLGTSSSSASSGDALTAAINSYISYKSDPEGTENNILSSYGIDESV